MSQCWSPWMNGDPYVLSRIKSTRSLCLQTKKRALQKKSSEMEERRKKAIHERQLRMAGVPEAAHGVPLRFKYPSGITRTRRFVLSESIQILFDFVGEEEDATEYFHIQDALSVMTLNSNMSGSLLENNISGSKTLYVHWIQTDDPEFVPALDSTNQVESPNFNNQFTWSPLPSPMSSPGHDGSFSPEGTDLGTILNRLGENFDHTSCPTSNQINICRDYTGNVHNILRSSLQAFRRRRFNPEARLDVVFVDSEQTSEERLFSQLCDKHTHPATLEEVSDVTFKEKLLKASQVPPNLRSSPSGGLLLAHGTADANVHFQHSAKLIKRLIRIGANYSMQIYPDEGHFLSPGSQLQLTQCLIGYFKGCLLDSSP
ncbi:unnamed protein product [Boreogadus saida]